MWKKRYWVGWVVECVDCEWTWYATNLTSHINPSCDFSGPSEKTDQGQACRSSALWSDQRHGQAHPAVSGANVQPLGCECAHARMHAHTHAQTPNTVTAIETWNHSLCLFQRDIRFFFFSPPARHLWQDARRIPAAGSSPLSAVRAFNVHACRKDSSQLYWFHVCLDKTQISFFFPFAVDERLQSGRRASTGQKEAGRCSFSCVSFCLSLHDFAPCSCVCNRTQCFIDEGWCGYAKLAALVRVYLPVCPALLLVRRVNTILLGLDAAVNHYVWVFVCVCFYSKSVFRASLYNIWLMKNRCLFGCISLSGPQHR